MLQGKTNQQNKTSFIPQASNPLLICLLVIYAIWTASVVLGNSFVYLYFKNAGVGDGDLIASFLFWSCATLLIMLFVNNKPVAMRTLMAAGVVAQVLMYASLVIFSPTRELLFFYAFLWGSVSFLFWVPLNVMYFELSKGREAFFSTIYFSMNPLFSLFLPLVGSSIASWWGFTVLFAITAACFISLLLLLLASGVGKRVQKYDLFNCLKELKGFKTLFLTEAIYGGGFMAAYYVVPLLYFNKPDELGMFLSVTTLFAILASFFVSRRSDLSGKRKKYLWFAAIALAISTFAMAFARDAATWYAICGIRAFFATIFWPFTTVIIADSKINMEKAMVGREWLLNTGRAFGVLCVLAFVLLASDAQASFAAMALFVCLYPVVIELKRRHIRIE